MKKKKRRKKLEKIEMKMFQIKLTNDEGNTNVQKLNEIRTRRIVCERERNEKRKGAKIDDIQMNTHRTPTPTPSVRRKYFVWKAKSHWKCFANARNGPIFLIFMYNRFFGSISHLCACCTLSLTSNIHNHSLLIYVDFVSFLFYPIYFIYALAMEQCFGFGFGSMAFVRISLLLFVTRLQLTNIFMHTKEEKKKTSRVKWNDEATE